MGKTKDLGHLAHIVAYDAENHITVPAGITMHTNQLVASQAWVTTALGSYALSSSLSSYVPTSRTITINGTTFDLSANRSWDITSMIYPAAGIPLSTGSAWGTSITNNSANWNTAFGWGNHASAGYLTGITSTLVTNALGFTPVTNARTITINGTAYDLTANRSWTVTATETDTLATVTGRGATTSSIVTFTSTTSDASVIVRNDGSGTSWRGRVGHFNATADKSVWFATYNGFAVVGAHNNALTAWADLLVNCVNNNGDGGTTRLSTSSFVGSNAIIHAGNIGSQTVSNSDMVDGYHVAVAGTANTIATRNASGYLIPENWIQLNGHYGLYSGTNNAHFYPNNLSYGSWRIEGSRNGWTGLHFGGGNGITLMMNEGEFGFHREAVGWVARFTSGTGHFNISGSAASASSASSATSATYFPTAYVGGQQTNPQVYFNNGIGLRAAMTGAWSVWSDTLWVNGYSGSDVPWMCALHFLRNSEPRFAISAQTHTGTGYGGYYEVITAYNIASQTVANLSGFNKSEPTFANVYNTGWFRNYADSGLYNQDYGCHLVRNGQSSHGAWSIFGYTKAGYIGMNLRDPQTYNNNLMYENGNGGMYTENANGWQWYYNRGSNCLGLGGSTTYNWVRAVVNGKLKIESDSIHTGWAYFDSNLQLAGGGNILYNEYNLWYVWRNWGGWGGEWINRNGGDMIMNLYAVYSVTGSISDIRYKKDVTALSYGLNEIMQLNPIKYHYNLPKESMLANDPDYFLGFSAQEVQALIPEAVHEKMGSDNKDGMLAITYDELIPVLVNGMKEQQVMIHNQNIKINKLEALVNQLLNN